MSEQRICPQCNGTGKTLDHAKQGALLRSQREQAGATLRTISAKMGISPVYLSDLERGRRNWSTALIKKHRTATGHEEQA